MPLLNTAPSSEPRKTVWQFIEHQFFYGILSFLYLVLLISKFLSHEYYRLKIRWINLSYYHNRTPELIRQDVMSLKKVPRHVAVVLRLREGEEGGGLDGLLTQTSELVAWCIGAEIEELTIYERTGQLKDLAKRDVRKRIEKNLKIYFGADALPSFKLRVPPITGPESTTVGGSQRTSGVDPESSTSATKRGPKTRNDIKIVVNLIAEEDGIPCITQLTQTLGDLAKEGQIRAKDVTISTITHELHQLVITDPDVILISGPIIDLEGFPPWQMRLSEIFHLPENEEVSYGLFLKGLERYAGCKINVGR